MEFPKDILVIDFEGKTAPTQIGAVLLDKESLVEKDSFLSYIYTDLQGHVSSVSGITQEMLDGAPSQSQAGKMLLEKFGTNVLLASWVASLDTTHFEKIMRAANIDTWKHYDYHVLDIWPAAYIYLLKQGYTGSLRSEAMFQAFGAKPRDLHNALEDCRITADVLRSIAKK